MRLRRSRSRQRKQRLHRTGCGRLPSRSVCVAAIGVGGYLYLTKLEMANRPKEAPADKQAAATPTSPVIAPHTVTSIAAGTPALTTAAPSPQAAGEKIAPASVPFIP